jgi:gluconokinase
MNLLCFDISSCGISAAMFDSNLEPIRFSETQWKIETDAEGAATLQAEAVADHFEQTVQRLDITGPIDALCIGAFMHNCVLLDSADQPCSPLFTWLDHRGQKGIEAVRSRIGDRFFERTGCHYHPMFPIFKLASLPPSAETKRIVSIKAFLIHRLTGTWVEDHGLASASGLYNIKESDWDAELLTAVGLERSQFPDIASRTAIVGRTTAATPKFGVPEGVPVINGSGDGFLANVGSDCEVPERLSVTLGTSAVVRQTLQRPVLNVSSGTFCYQADAGAFLLGCAGSNGGNVLDWGRGILGASTGNEGSGNPPIFIPLLHGERSPDWDPGLTGSWYGLTARHNAADLSRSILEGVVFNLAHFVEIVQETSKKKAAELVLSGNGFLDPLAASILAEVVGIPISMPASPGLASLRGAAVCSLRALRQPVPRLKLMPISATPDPAVVKRYGDYRRFRAIR